jgi:pilus assembly protein CpaE
MSRKVLVVDDHPETVRLIEMTLRRHGYQVYGVESGASALAWAATQQPDLVLLDLMMPDIDGYTVCRKLREDRRLRDVPVIMFTAKSEVRDKKEGFEAGANDYLVKPTRPSELISRVEAILARNDQRLAEIGSTFEQIEGGEEALLPAVAVIGARGGVGATTVAINLAASLADQGRPTTLVDLDLQQGHVGLYLGLTVSRGVADWLRLPASRLADELPSYRVEAGDRLALLPARPQPTESAGLPPSAPLVAAMAALAQGDRMLVLDMGRNRGDAALPVLRRVRHILICIRSERAAVSAARQIVEQLAPQLAQPEVLHTLMIETGTGENLPRRAVESYLGYPLYGVVTLEQPQIAEAVNRNLPLVRALPESQTAQRFREIAAELTALEKV